MTEQNEKGDHSVHYELAWWRDPSKIKQTFLTWAEMIDAFRLIPRGIVVAYGWLLINVIQWYMSLEAYIPSDVKELIKDQQLSAADIKMLMTDGPSTQHAALVTAVVGISAAIFGLYSNSGRKWSGPSKSED